VIARTQGQLAKKPRALRARLLEMPGHRLVDTRRFHELDQSQLHGVVAVDGRRPPLDHHARSRFEQRHRHGLSIRAEDLGHSDFFAKDSWNHKTSSGLRVGVTGWGSRPNPYPFPPSPTCDPSRTP